MYSERGMITDKRCDRELVSILFLTFPLSVFVFDMNDVAHIFSIMMMARHSRDLIEYSFI